MDGVRHRQGAAIDDPAFWAGVVYAVRRRYGFDRATAERLAFAAWQYKTGRLTDGSPQQPDVGTRAAAGDIRAG
jgi:hypothetical protein